MKLFAKNSWLKYLVYCILLLCFNPVLVHAQNSEVVLFNGLDIESNWQPYGPGFASFATLEEGVLHIDVPNHQGWSQVGLISKHPLVKFNHQKVLYKHEFQIDFDAKKTSGFIIEFMNSQAHAGVKVIYQQNAENAVLSVHRDGVKDDEINLVANELNSLSIHLYANGFAHVNLENGQVLQTSTVKHTLPEAGYYFKIHTQAANYNHSTQLHLTKVVMKSSIDNITTNDKILFDGNLMAGKFIPHAAHGGNFKEHASFDNGLRIEVPENNTWGKVGILSPHALVWLNEFGTGSRQTVNFQLDDSNTSSFTVGLVNSSYGGVRGNDPGTPSALFKWQQHLDKGLSVAKLIIDKNEVWSQEYPLNSPNLVQFILKPHSISLAFNNQFQHEANWNILQEGIGLRVWAYSEASAVNQAVKMELEKIYIDNIITNKKVAAKPQQGVAELPIQSIFKGESITNWSRYEHIYRGSDKFCVLDESGLKVEVPAADYGRCGIRSNDTLIDLDSRINKTENQLSFQFEPKSTNNFLIVLSPYPEDKTWNRYSGTCYFTLDNSRSDTSTFAVSCGHYNNWSNKIDPEWLKNEWNGEFNIIQSKSWISAGFDNGKIIRMPVQPSRRTFLFVLTNPWNSLIENGAKIILKDITQQWLATDNMSAGERWQFVDDDAFNPDVFLQEILETENEN